MNILREFGSCRTNVIDGVDALLRDDVNLDEH